MVAGAAPGYLSQTVDAGLNDFGQLNFWGHEVTPRLNIFQLNAVTGAALGHAS